MERLVSSSQSSTALSLSRRRFLSLRLAGGGGDGVQRLHFNLRLPSVRTDLKPMRVVSSNLEKPSPSSPCRSYFGFDNPEKHNSSSSPLFLRKVAPAVAFVVLSVLIVTIIKPILAPTAAFAVVESASGTGENLFTNELLSSAWTGFLAGCLHTLSGPDHLVALAPLSIGRTRLESAAVGALWGCGHDAGQVIFGLLFLFLKDQLHIEIMQTWGTRILGLTLLIIGAMGVKEASEVPARCVALENPDCDVNVIKPVEKAPKEKKRIGFATFATGIVHGLQPDALMIVLPALALPSRLAGAAFLGMFLVGTVFAMGSYTAFIGSCSQALKDKVPTITEKLTWAASLVAISMGLAILISQFFGFSLY